MSWNLMTRVPYSFNLFIAFLSLSNFALVRPRGLLFDKSPRGRMKYTLGHKFLLAFLPGHGCC